MVEAQRRGGEAIMSMGRAGALAQRWAGVRNRAPAVRYRRVFGGRPFAVRIAANI
jgi:hypothetical protein